MTDYANSAFSPGNLDAVTTNTTTGDTVNYDIGTPGGNPLSPDTADKRATRFHLGLQDNLSGATPDDISQSLQKGDEGVLRQQAAADIDQKKYNDQLTAYSASKDPNAARVFLRPFIPTNPETVAEEAYGQKYMNKMYDAAYNIQDSFMNEAMENIPEVVTMTKQTASGVAASIQYAIGKAEDADEVIKNQGTLPWIGDIAKPMVIPGYRAYKQGTTVMGNAVLYYELDKKAQDLLTENPNLPDFKPKFDAIYNELLANNPEQASLFAHSVVGFSSREKFVGSVLNTVDTVGAATGVLGVAKLINNVRKAFQTSVRASATHSPSPASVAEGNGDIESAAILRASETLQQGSDGTYRPVKNNLSTASAGPANTPPPTQAGLDALPSGLRSDRQALVQDARDTGSLSRELTVRLEQDYLNAEQKVIDTRVSTPSIQRTALDYATPAQIAEIKKNVVESQYPAVHNMILDIGDPVWDDLYKGYRIPTKFGDYDAIQFMTEEQARARMVQEGFIDGTVEGNVGKKGYIPESAIKRPWEEESRFGEARVEKGAIRYFDKDGIEYAVTTKPEKGMVPVSLEPAPTEASGYSAKFHPTLKSDADVATAVAEQHGLGFHFTVWTTLDEDNHLVRDLLANLQGSKSLATTPGLNRWVNSILGFGYARNSDNTLSAFETHQRKTATYAISKYHKFLQDEMQIVEDVARGRMRISNSGNTRNPVISKLDSFGRKLTQRKVWDEFRRMLSQGPRTPDPEHPGEMGYFYRTVSELNSAYLSAFQRLPSFTEVRGYQAFRRLYEEDRIFRGLSEYSFKAQTGAMQHQFNIGNVASGFFEGVPLKEFPSNEWPLAWVERDGSIKILRGEAAGSNYKKYVEAVRDGTVQAVEVYNPELFPFNHIPKMSGEFIRYVVAPRFERKNLDWNQINRKSGGHFDFDFEHSIKQAHIHKVQVGNGQPQHLYLGDKTFALLKSKAQGELIVPKLNRAMELMPTDEAAAKRIIQDELSINWDKWKKEFSPTKNPTTGAVTPPRLKLGEPFRVVPKGGSIASLDSTLADRFKTTLPNGKVVDTWRDGTHSSSMARNRQVQYTQERDSEDLMTMHVEGTKNNPIYKYQPAEFVDPIETMNRALNNITKTSFMDDMKKVSMQLWLNEARPYFTERMKKTMSSSPYSTFLNAVDKHAFLPNAPAVIVKNLLSNRYKTKLFLGMPSAFDTQMHQISQALADQAFDKIGPKGDLIPFWLLGKIDSPARALRAMAYHFKMGVWSPHQIITQGQSFATIAAVAPRSAVGGTIANFLHEYALWNHTPAMLDKLDQIAVYMGHIPGFHAWKTGEWKELFQHLIDGGFDKVGGEYAALDTQMNKSWIRNEWGKFLDVSQFFFQGIESRVRRGAWYTAGLEAKRATNSGLPFTKAEVAAVLDRADDLSGNMSRATASILQSGPLSPIMQFQKYQIGLAEYFWGKRLAGPAGTTTERNMARLRLFLTYQMIFGFAGAVGLGGLPMGDYFRKIALSHGYEVGDNWLSSMVMEGPTSAAIAWASGDLHNIKKGNWYNLQKFGANGITQISDLFDVLNGDKSAWQMIPSTSIGYNAWKDSGSLRRDLISMYPGHEKDAVTKIKVDHVLKLLSEVTTMESIYQAKAALGTGKWMTRNDQPQGDVTKMNALTMAVTGLSMRKFDDNYLYDQMAKADKQTNDFAKGKAREELQRAIDAMDNKDRQQYLDYVSNAFAWLHIFDVPDEQINDVVSGTLKRNQDKSTTSRYSWAFGRETPQSQRPLRQDVFKDFQNNEKH